MVGGKSGPPVPDPRLPFALGNERTLDAESLKAFAHPLRMALYGALQDHGAATASQLARRLGESSGQTSYHLRQLEKHGFIEDDPAHQGGRERWWRARGFNFTTWDSHDPDQAKAARLMLSAMVVQRAEVLQNLIDRFEQAGDPHGAVSMTATIAMTRTELDAMVEETVATIQRHVDASKAAHPPGDGAPRVRVYFDAVPLALDDSSDEQH